MGDPDLQIRWGRGGHPDPDIRGGGAVSKKNVSALWASVWSKNKGGGGRPPPLDPPLLNVFYNKFRLYKSCIA